MRTLFLGLAAAAAMAFALPVQAAAPLRPAAPPADMNLYRGKTITYIVATNAGGGYDTYARMIARYMMKYLPGSRVLIKNVPGAGHLVGTNTLYVSRPDGMTIGMFNTGIIYNQLLQRPGVQFDLNKINWIGSAAHDIRVFVISSRSGFKSFEELVKSGQPIKVAVAGVGSAAYNDTRIVAAALKLNVQLIAGFDGNEGELSMRRGEVMAQLGAASSFENFIRTGGGFYALAVSGNSRVLPGVPQARQFVKDERGMRLLSLIESLSELGRLTAAPPGVPANMLAALREAHLKALNDPGLLKEARDLKLPIDPLSADDVEVKIKQALAQPPAAIALLREATGVDAQ